MSREWKPGDVAMLTFTNGEQAVGVRSHKNDGWEHSGLWACGSASDAIAGAKARPLVVIDPESWDSIGELREALFGLSSHAHGIPKMQEALREFANPTPPKPDEPMGLGAVVEDAEGNRYIRYGASLAPWIGSASNKGIDPDRPYRYWDGIKAVRVLSEGVTS